MNLLHKAADVKSLLHLGFSSEAEDMKSSDVLRLERYLKFRPTEILEELVRRGISALMESLTACVSPTHQHFSFGHSVQRSHDLSRKTIDGS
jgi:hypothetical protein